MYGERMSACACAKCVACMWGVCQPVQEHTPAMSPMWTGMSKSQINLAFAFHGNVSKCGCTGLRTRTEYRCNLGKVASMK